MIVLMTLSVVMVMAMCSLAYMLATYAVPFLFAVMATRFAFATGAGYLGAGIVGLFAGVGAYGFLAYLYATLRSPGLRLDCPDIRGSRCHYRFRPGAWCRPRGGSVRSLAENLLPHRRCICRPVGAGEAG